jgi:sortase A
MGQPPGAAGPGDAGSTALTLTETALDREMLLVPAPLGAGTEVSALELERELLPPEDRAPVGEVRPGAPHPLVSQVRSALVMVALLTIGLVFQLTWVSGWVHRSAQNSMYNQFRSELALGTAPLGPRHPLLALGQPMALITIPSIGVSQVVAEGTTGQVLTSGPGHLRSTVFPGGAGTSVIMGRSSSYGGPFGRIHELRPGARIKVITQVGTSQFRVIAVQHGGGVVRQLIPGSGRLILETADGTSYVPSGVVSVIANKIGPGLSAQRPLVRTVPPDQRPLGVDTGSLWLVDLGLAVFGAVLAAAVWTWYRRGHAQAWIVFGAPLLLIWFFVADQVSSLLPNLL